MIYFCVFDTVILQWKKFTSTAIRKVAFFFFFKFISLFLINIPKKNIQQQQAAIKRQKMAKPQS